VSSNLFSLGVKQGRVDAQALVSLFATTALVSSAKPGGRTKIRQQAYHVTWEAPRRAASGTWSWRPLTVPWSPLALEIYAADPARATRGSGSGLVTEHVVPVVEIVNELMAGPQTVSAYLRTMRRLCVITVLTAAEDAMISAAGYAHSHPDPSDPWSRLTLSGLDVSTFAVPDAAGPVQSWR
jgi:hypothetical protein